MVAFRDHLARHRTLEAAYLDIVRRNLKFPHIFLNQIVHVILRNVLDDCDDAFVLRAAELFFRPQKLTLHEGSLVAADEETVSGLGNKPLSPLVSMLGLAGRRRDRRAQRGQCRCLLGAQRPVRHGARPHGRPARPRGARRGRQALDRPSARASRWTIEPLVELQDATLTWYVGLDADATRIGDALWKGDEIDEATRGRVVGLYRLTFADPADVVEKVRGEPVYLMTAMAADKVLRLKPQNLVTGLPVRHLEAVS